MSNYVFNFGENINAGFGLTWKDEYNELTNYEENDAVSFNGSSYIAIQPSTGIIPTTVTHWGVLALKGADGTGGTGVVTSVNGQTGDVVITGGGASAGKDVLIEDNENYFTSVNIEGALQEIGKRFKQTEVNVWSFENLITSKPTPTDPNTWDWTPAIQGAIDSIVAERDMKGTYFVTAKLVFPAGKYRHKGFTSKPFVRITTSGFVLFSYFGNVTTPSIKISATETELAFYKNMYTRGSVLDGSNGGICLMNENAGRPVGSVGLEVEHMANYAVNDVAITGFESGIMLIPIQHWLGRYDRLHLEENTYNIVWGKTVGQGSTNSGENFTFTDCNINGGTAAIKLNSDTPDFAFYGTSLNFNKYVVLISGGHGYTAFKFTDCFIEANQFEFFKNEVDPSTLGWYQTPSFYVNSLTSLTAPKVLFSGQMNVFIDMFEVRLSKAPVTVDQLFMFNTNGKVAVSNLHFPGYTMIKDINENVNPNLFHSFPVGTSAVSNSVISNNIPFLDFTTYGKMVEKINSAIVTDEVLFNGKKTFKISSNDSSCRIKFGFSPANRIAAKAGDEFSAKLLAGLNSSNNVGFQWQFVAYDANGNRITAITEKDWWSMGLNADSSKVLKAVETKKSITCPIGTAYVDVYMLINGINGDLYLADLFISKLN